MSETAPSIVQPPDRPAVVNGSGVLAGRARMAHVDCARGIAILLIAFWHSGLRPAHPMVATFAQLVVVPTFILAAGLFFSVNDRSFSSTRRRMDALLRPYIIVSCLAIVLAVLRRGDPIDALVLGTLRTTGDDLPVGWAPLWFLPTLALTYLAAWAACRWLPAVVQRLASSPALAMACLAIVVWLVCRPEALLFPAPVEPRPSYPLNVDLVPLFFTLMLVGVAAKPQLIDPSRRWGLLAASLAVFVACAVLASPQLDMNRRVWSPLVPATLGCVFGCLAVFRVSALVSQTPVLGSTLARLGRDSLYILCFHMYIGSNIAWQLAKLPLFTDPGGQYLAAWVAFVLSVTVTCLMASYIRKVDWLRALMEPREARDGRKAAAGHPSK